MSPAMLVNSYYPDYIHPLDMPEIKQSEPYKSSSPTTNDEDWEKLIEQFESQPDLLQLIQICKIEEQKRCYEETRAKLKEYQVIHQLENMQARDLFSDKISKKELHLKLPSAISVKEIN